MQHALHNRRLERVVLVLQVAVIITVAAAIPVAATAAAVAAAGRCEGHAWADGARGLGLRVNANPLSPTSASSSTPTYDNMGSVRKEAPCWLGDKCTTLSVESGQAGICTDVFSWLSGVQSVHRHGQAAAQSESRRNRFARRRQGGSGEVCGVFAAIKFRVKEGRSSLGS